MKFPIIAVFALVLKVCSGTSHPPAVRFNACDPSHTNFQECWRQSIQAQMKTFGQPLPLVGDLWEGVLEPYRLEKVTIGPGRYHLNGQLIIRLVESSGWSNLEVENATLDLAGSTHISDVKAHIPLLKLKGQYEADGKILGRDFKGRGSCVILFENAAVQMKLYMEPQRRLNVDFWKVISSNLSLDPEKVRFEFENQPQHLVNKINERWRDVFSDAKADFEHAAVHPYTNMIRLMLEITPISVFLSHYGQ